MTTRGVSLVHQHCETGVTHARMLPLVSEVMGPDTPRPRPSPTACRRFPSTSCMAYTCHRPGYVILMNHLGKPPPCAPQTWVRRIRTCWSITPSMSAPRQAHTPSTSIIFVHVHSIVCLCVNVCASPARGGLLGVCHIGDPLHRMLLRHGHHAGPWHAHHERRRHTLRDLAQPVTGSLPYRIRR